MLKRIISFSIFISLLSISVSPALARSKGSWDDVKQIVGQEIVAKTKSGKMNYGVLRSAYDGGIKLELTGDKALSGIETAFTKDEVKKVWRASLFSGDRNTGKGALIGAAAGAGAGGVVFAASSDDPLSGAAIPLFAVAGAAIGGVFGFLSKTKHKKRELIYKQ